MKIFGIGLNKTGTSTLSEAGRRFGFLCKSWDRTLFNACMIDGDRDQLWATVEQFDLLEDFPYPLLYRELDTRFPGSKFVLTRRLSADKWLRSIKAHALRSSPWSSTHRIVYGCKFPHGRESVFLNHYEHHNAAAREYFQNRPNDFLEVCWEDEKSLERLARFLGVDITAAAAFDLTLPHANAGESKLVNPMRVAINAFGIVVQQISGQRGLSP